MAQGTRRIVFAGGIQAKALAKAYRLDVAAQRDEDVFFVGADVIGREAAHRVIAAADVVVSSVSQAGDAVPTALIPTRATLVCLPHIDGSFLWPFAGRPHPRNAAADALPDGPYPADFGDSHLDRLMEQGVAEDDAIEGYLDFDLAAGIDLDGRLHGALSAQRALDSRTGFDLADYVESRFRADNLFATRDRIRLPLFQRVAAQLYARLGAEPGRGAALPETHFPAGEMPIHPSVLHHFSLQAPLPDHRYPVLDEGLFTFEHYCRRYYRYAWNEGLHAAMALAETDPAAAIPALRLALDESPGSRAGRLALDTAERAASDVPLPCAAAAATSERNTQPVAMAAPEPIVAIPAAWSQGARHIPVVTWALSPTPSRRPVADIPDVGGLPVSASRSSPGAADPASDPPRRRSVPEQQSYVELSVPYTPHGPAETLIPVRPSQEFIDVLPRLLPTGGGLAGAMEGAFSSMPETMPPPPLRPVLPPEQQTEPARRGLMGRLFGRK